LRTSEFDYHLPAELIAQHPLARREDSRLLVVGRSAGTLADMAFRDLPELLAPGDILALNDTRVFPARLRGKRSESGGNVEVLFLHPEAPRRWVALTRSGGKLRVGERLLLSQGRLRVRLVERRGMAGDVLELPAGLDLPGFLHESGEVPLPPYIKRESGEFDSEDRERYQTRYAADSGAVAAPTAGLHFDEEVFARLEARGVARATLTLHVGPGTFRPVKSESLEDHHMDAEAFVLASEEARKINSARAAGGRLVAVGTTTTRTLETLAKPEGLLAGGEGWTELFIAPPYRFKVVDALLTNFHLPRSTLLMLVSAFAGTELVKAAYRHAVAEGYRFYSYGDCCLFI
jgi:S-adenosylmethionine:tRNA ribosyltransferase-isomerase